MLHKMKLKKIFFWYLEKKIFNLNWIYLHKNFITKYSITYTRTGTFDQILRMYEVWKQAIYKLQFYTKGRSMPPFA